MQEVILFIMTYLFVFIIYEIFIVSKTIKLRKKGHKYKEPIEVKYLVNRYKLDLEKVNYNKLLHIVSIVSALDISVVVSIIFLLNNFILEVVVGFILIICSILISYHIIYLFYKKGGMIKND